MADGSQNVLMAEMMGGMYGPNPYSPFQGRIPMPGYRGTPTDAMGNPIQPPPGMTLNSPPPAAAPSAADMTPGGPNTFLSGAARPQGQYIQTSPGGQMPSGENYGSATPQTIAPQYQYMPAQQSAAPSQATPPQTASGANLQDTIAMLGNPGKVNTQGATVPQSTVGGQPSVLQQFLASQKGGTGANTYSNTGFFDTLNALGGR
jgi:hypothetical protein